MKKMNYEKSLFLMLSVFVSIFVFLFVGCAKKKTPLPEHPGAKIFQGDKRLDVKCHGCHGWLGEGSKEAPSLLQSGKTLPHEEFVDIVMNGRGNMPPFKTVLSENDILLIVDWLEKLPHTT